MNVTDVRDIAVGDVAEILSALDSVKLTVANEGTSGGTAAIDIVGNSAVDSFENSFAEA